jgi:hypothetical protein
LDSGSNHNFLNPTILCMVFLPVNSHVQLHARVANGAWVLSEGLCHSVSLKLQGHLFTTDFYLLPSGGMRCSLGHGLAAYFGSYPLGLSLDDHGVWSSFPSPDFAKFDTLRFHLGGR